MRVVGHFSIAAALSFGLIGFASAQSKAIPEPPTLWQGEMHSTTPETLRGATVLDVSRLADLIARDKPVMIDVSHADRKPPGMAADARWVPVHLSLPGATWLPGAGDGTSDPSFVQAFKSMAETMTGGDKDKAIVTFCHPNRWGSWNAAKRLTELGYRHVYWYPGGAEGWVEGGNRLSQTKPRLSSRGFEALAEAAAKTN